MDRKSLAICIIAGNEEQTIERCLDSAFAVTDVVVVVGAVGGAKPDRTLQIARKRGCIVSEYRNSPATRAWPFVDDFAAARNQSFRIGSSAVGQDGWLMWLDCDDVIDDRHVQKFQEAIKHPEDWILCDYVLPDHGKVVIRERLFRCGSAAWVNAVHEKCVPVSMDDNQQTIKVRVIKEMSVIHLPLESKSGSQERNLTILKWRDNETQHIKFYLHYENYLLGKKEEAIKYGLEAAALSNLDAVYRYEILINLALLAGKNEHGQEMLRDAIKLEPNRREALHCLALLQIDGGQFAEAISSCEKYMKIPAPTMPQWTHRPDVYGWKGTATLAWAHRKSGNATRAEQIEATMLESASTPRISLLHATRGRAGQAISAMGVWRDRAKNGEAVEHIFAIDEGDKESQKMLSQFKSVIVAEGGFSVAAWNAAAKSATGQILVQIADDFEPRPGWDSEIVAAFGDKINSPCILMTDDAFRKDGLITLAIVTQKWYEENGLFDDNFRNVYSDHDLTQRAKLAGAILDARHIKIQHHHPFSDSKIKWDATYERGNNKKEYERAKAYFEKKHSLSLSFNPDNIRPQK